MTRVGDRTQIVRACALIVAIALIGVAVVLALRAQSLRDDPALANRALLDEAAARGVTTEVSRGLAQVFSYDWSQPGITKAAADQLLSGQAREEYDTLFASLQERAPDQKLTLSTQVQIAGVQRLTETKATLLVFLDQSSSRAEDEESSVSAAQLRVEAERDGRAWVITALTPL
jgi:Mce-associated membrane protein